MSSPLRALILTEAGGSRGLGHLSRCSALHEALLQHRVQTSLLVDLPSDSTLSLSESGQTARPWLRTPPEPNELAGTDIVIIDSYVADVELYQSIASAVPCLVSFDDTCRIPYPPGLIVNPCISAIRALYEGYEGGLLVGADYAPLRRPFWRCRPRTMNESISKVLISVGGQENTTLGLHIASSLAQQFPSLQLQLLSSASMAPATKRRNIEVTPRVDAEGVYAAMQWCDVAISAGGQTLHELGAAGVPTIMFAIVDNQLPNVMAWEESGAFVRVDGATAEELASHIPAALNQLSSPLERRIRSERAQRLVDGRGALRLASAIIDTVASRSISIRRARRDDCEQIYQISNHPSVRAHSFSGQPIDFHHHQKWLDATLLNPEILFLVATLDGGVVGQIRIERRTQHTGIVNISVSPQYRRSKIGNALLHAAYRESRSFFPEMLELLAYIQISNVNSIAFFERSGFGSPRQCCTGETPCLEYRYPLQRG